MPTLETLVEHYLAIWNEANADRRRALIAEAYADDATYSDPLAEVSGRAGIDALIAGAQQQFPGLVFSLGSPIDAHHDVARFAWHLGTPGATEPLVVGFDVIATTQGRIARVYGFLDKVPATL